MPTSTSRRDLDPGSTLRLLAGPLVVLGVVAAALSAAEVDGGRAAENAGRVVNGRKLLRNAHEVIGLLLEERPPEILVVGNSAANTNLDPDRLARGLHVPREAVVVLSLPNSVSSHWYAVLKNHVFAAGYRPKEVLLVSGLGSALVVEPYTPTSYEELRNLLNEQEPVLDPLIVRYPPWGDALIEKRRLLREGALGGLRDAVGAALGRDLALDLEAVLEEGERRALPSGWGEPFAGGHLAPEVGVLPALAELTRENGARLTLVVSPTDPSQPLPPLEQVPDDALGRVEALLLGQGHRLVDGRALLDPASLPWQNTYHLRAPGARAWTDALVPILRPPR